MPIYEYECRSCGVRIEKFQKINDDPLVTCPECREDSLQKLVSAAAFKLSGSGWYETDFKDKKPKSDKKPAGEKETKKTDNKSSESVKTPANESTPKKSGTSSE